jgi:AbrB family looped-hinge helix DNA binding protein
MEAGVKTVTVSPKYQVVIPQGVRESLGIKPGQKLDVFEYDGRIEFVLVRHPREMRGFLSGIDTSVDRDPDRV